MRDGSGSHLGERDIMPMLTHTLSAYAINFGIEDLTSTARAHLEDAFVNWIGCAIGGANEATVDAYARAASLWTPTGNHSVLGREGQFALPDAIAIDCLSSAVLAFDDTHLETVLHPTGPIAAALLGQSRLQPMSGIEFIAALHVGMEIECRVGLAVVAAGTGSKRGWYLTGITGGIGAAAAVGKILNFDLRQMESAMGLASARAAGNRGTHGSTAAAYVPSLAAESGFAAAHLTCAGIHCDSRALDGSNGLLELITIKPDVERALAGLGTVSEAERTAFKPFPAGIVAHPVIEACLRLAKQDGVHAENIKSIEFRISQTAYDLVANKFPKDVVQAQVSLYYWGAVAIATGSAGVHQASLLFINDPAIHLLQEKMTAVVDDDLADDQCVATTVTHSNQTNTVRIEHAIGSVHQPMTRLQVDAKFFGLANPAIGSERAAQLHAACRDLSSLNNVADLLDL